MHKTLLIFKNKKLAGKLRSLNVWNESSGFEIGEIRCSLYREFEKYNEFELVIADKEFAIELLKQSSVKRIKLRVAICDTEADFQTARQGIVLGAKDYITVPLDVTSILSLLNRTESELSRGAAQDILTAELLLDYFESRDKGYYAYLNDLLERLKKESKNISNAAGHLKRIYERVWEEISSKYQWLDLYLNDKIFRLSDSSVPATVFEHNAVKLMTLFSEFCQLYPKHNAQLDEVISTILNYPEGDLRQKTLSSELHINSTYLSTVFLAQTDIRFVDYVNTVKLKRAAWLLLNTNLEIAEVAKRLDYKDKSYFSKLFKRQYGSAPSLFRIPPDYDFQI